MGQVLPVTMRSRSAPVPSNKSSQQKKQKAASLLQLTACFYVWSERLDSNQRPPAPKAGALPCCATLRDGMFCTQKALLWQGQPVWRPKALPALGEKPPPAGQGRGPLSLARQMTAADRAPSIDKDERGHAGRASLFPPRRKRISQSPSPANAACLLPCSQKKRDLSFQTPGPGSRHSAAEGVSGRNQRQKKKNPARKRGDFLMGRKMGLEPTATWATTRCSTN